MMEELNLVCMDLYASKAQTGSVDISMKEVYNKLTNDMEVKRHVYPVDGTSTISLVDSTQSSVTMLNDGEAIGSDGVAGKNTVTIELDEESNSTSYYLEANGKYYPMSIRNLQVALDEENATTTPPTGAGSLGSGLTIKFIDSGTSEETDTSSYVEKSLSGTTLTLTAKANAEGSTQVVVRDGEVELTGNIAVTVNPTYTISIGTVTNGSIKINGETAQSSTKYGKDVEITLTAIGNQGYAFEKWTDNNSTTNQRTIQVSSTTAAVTYTATFVESKLYGAQVKLNGGNPITVKGSNTIEDNWKLFYIDDAADGYVHLIYGDYYPANVQTEITSGNTIFAPAHKDANNNASSDSSYAWTVNSYTNRLTLLKYLKNNASYAEANLDTSTPAGSYDSWTNLVTALTGTGKALNGKTIRVQGAPNITMWKNSWNEQGYTELALDDSGNNATGYNVRLATANANSNSNYYISLSSYSGYQDRLYFPNRGSSSTTDEPNGNKALGYWLASPGGSSSSYVCHVYCRGGVFCGYIYNSDYLSARPVVSILKSDFQSISAFSGISISK